MVILLDTGPWVALHCRDDAFHQWARAEFSRHAGPFLTCEAVVAETCFLLARGGHDPSKALAMIERGAVRLGLSLSDECEAVRKLFERFDNVPASLADACLIRMSEIFEDSRVLTLDHDFDIYRRHGRRTIPFIAPVR